MSRFMHTLDDRIIVGSVVMDLAFFLALELDYTGVPPKWSRRYVPGKLHVISNGHTQRSGGYLTWPEGDAYIAKEALYAQALAAQTGETQGEPDPLPQFQIRAPFSGAAAVVDVPRGAQNLEIAVLVRSLRAATLGAFDLLTMRINDDATALYSTDQAIAPDDTLALALVPSAGTEAGFFASLLVALPGYRGVAAYQPVICSGVSYRGAPLDTIERIDRVGVWRQRAAVTRLGFELTAAAAEGSLVVVRGSG